MSLHSLVLVTALNKLVGHCWLHQHACQVPCVVFARVMLYVGADVGTRMGMSELDANVGLGSKVCWIATGVGLKQLHWWLLL